jgi:hypothetical protein
MPFMFWLVPIISVGMFVLVFSIIISTFVKNAKRERENDRSPRITAPAHIVAKRTHVSGHRSGSSSAYHSVTTYYVTFQFQSGDRMEFAVQGYEYGLLIEGDQGDLTFQGNRYLGFQRT